MIQSKVMKKFIELAGERLEGDWVLIGGSVLHLLEHDYRTTIDIDFVSKDKNGKDQTLELAKIADDLGLPIESINQAGAFFLHRIKGFSKRLLPISESKKIRIYRPNLSLYIELKSERLSDSDLQDCLEMIKVAKKTGDGHQLEEAKTVLKRLLKNPSGKLHKEKLKTVGRALDS